LRDQTREELIQNKNKERILKDLRIQPGRIGLGMQSLFYYPFHHVLLCSVLMSEKITTKFMFYLVKNILRKRQKSVFVAHKQVLCNRNSAEVHI
jgi:hypothetical protein